MPASPPPPDTAVPDQIRRLAGGRPVRPVWRNELGGLTFAVGDLPEVYDQRTGYYRDLWNAT